MPRQKSIISNDAIQRQQALSRWDNEGGAGASPPVAPTSDKEHHPLTTHAATHMTDLIERSSRFR